MTFEQVSTQTPITRQLIINHTQVAPTDDRATLWYDDGTPTSLILRSTANNDHMIIVKVKPMMVLGRKSSIRDYEVNIDLTELQAVDFGVSRYHAMMLALDNRICIKDLNSLNGTFLNHKRMLPSAEYVIVDGDTVALGELELLIEFDYQNE